MKHKHHIVPKHLGGSNAPSNLIEVTVEEHALIHHNLWQLEGRWQDKVAWETLSGQISSDEARRLAVSYALKGKTSHRKGKCLSPKHRENMIKSKTGKPIHTAESKAKISKNNARYWLGKTRVHTEEANRKRSEAMIYKYKHGYVSPMTGKTPWNKGSTNG